jgi:hypothetical protein
MFSHSIIFLLFPIACLVSGKSFRRDAKQATDAGHLQAAALNFVADCFWGNSMALCDINDAEGLFEFDPGMVFRYR